MRILLVEDDEVLCQGLTEALTIEKHEVLAAGTAAAARRYFDQAPDFVILDLNLPDGNGFALCRELKERQELPVIFLTARDDDRDMVKGLDLGADDYITKPFRLNVLLSRLRAVARRYQAVKQKGSRLVCGELCLLPEETRVLLAGNEMILTAGEFKLLQLLMEHKGQTLTRGQLLERLWDDEGNFVNDNTLTVMMKRLRRKLDSGPEQYIRTVRGIGYKVVEYE